MIQMLFATEAESASGIGALGVNPGSFVIQLISFILVFLLLKRFAFKPIVAMLEERRRTIDDGVKLGQKLEKEREKFNEEVANAMREARHEADKIIANAHKEAREVIRDGEKAAQRKTDAMITDAHERIEEDMRRAKLAVEKDIVNLVSEATEAIVGEKVDVKKDAELIDKILKRRK